MKPQALLSWSSGKDSAWALHVLRAQATVEVVGLVTSYNEAFNRVAMHGVRMELVQAQAASLGLPLWQVPLPWPCSNEMYEHQMGVLFKRALAAKITIFAFGDLFLEEIRAYRVQQFAGTGIEPIFPLWGTATTTPSLARRMIREGLRSTLVCIDPKQCNPCFAGREFDEKLLTDLPSNIDPCGENGEFHTFCHAGPMFEKPVSVQLGAIVERDGFCFADLEPRMTAASTRAVSIEMLESIRSRSADEGDQSPAWRSDAR